MTAAGAVGTTTATRDEAAGYSSRDRDDDDDRGSRQMSRGGGRGNQGHGGWFGDSEGHAEAARRGWADRR